MKQQEEEENILSLYDDDNSENELIFDKGIFANISRPKISFRDIFIIKAMIILFFILQIANIFHLLLSITNSNNVNISTYKTSYINIANIISYISFIIFSFLFSDLIHQRMSVPEYKCELTLSISLIFASIISSICIFALNQQFLILNFNMIYFAFIISSFTFCIICFICIYIIDKSSIIHNDKICFYYVEKILLLFAMLIGGSLFIICIALNRKSDLIVPLYHYSILLFYIAFVVYIALMQSDIEYVYMTLCVLPDVEYFVDLDQKNTL